MKNNAEMDVLIEKSKTGAKEAEKIELEAQKEAAPPRQELGPTVGMLNKAAEIEEKIRKEVLEKVKPELQAYTACRGQLENLTKSLEKYQRQATALSARVEDGKIKVIDMLAGGEDPKETTTKISELEKNLNEAQTWTTRLKGGIPQAETKLREARARLSEGFYRYLGQVRMNYEGELRQLADSFCDITEGYMEAVKRLHGELQIPARLDLIERDYGPKLADHQRLFKYLESWDHLLNRSLVRPRAKSEEQA